MKTNTIYVSLTIGVILLIVISFHFLTNFSAYWIQPAARQITVVGETRFELLDYHQNSSPCWHGHESENLYLFSASSTNKEDILQFLKEFKPLNNCNTWILFQKGAEIAENWKEAAHLKPLEVALPSASFAHSFYQSGSFSLTDLAGGKVNGKFSRYNSEGKLVSEQQVVNNIRVGDCIIYKDGYRIRQIWENDKLICVDTIK